MAGTKEKENFIQFQLNRVFMSLYVTEKSNKNLRPVRLIHFRGFKSAF